MTTVEAPVCLLCRHYDAEAPGYPGRCAAFPDGIPEDIWELGNPHTEPYPGDHGIRFEEVDTITTCRGMATFGDCW